MEGMFSFDRTPMAPIGTEVMIHVKPTSRQAWGYHTIPAWYLTPALSHYRCIKAVTEAGAVRVSDTFRFLHHTLPIPTITNTDRFVKATQHLVRTIDGHQDAPPDELRATQNLRNLLTGATRQPLATEANQDIEPDKTNPAQPIAEPTPIPQPIHIAPDPIHTAPAAQPTSNLPNVIPFDDNEYEPSTDPEPHYNLRSRNHIFMSAIALVGEANTRGMLVNVVIDQKTGDPMEYCLSLIHI